MRTVAWAFITLMIVLAVAGASGVTGFRRLSATVTDGAMVRAFEQHYDRNLPWRDFSVNVWTAAQVLAFSEGRQGVVIGRDGWLFTDEEFGVPPDGRGELEHNLNLIGRAARQLRAHSVPLLVVMVPEKAVVYADHLGRRKPTRLHAEFPVRLKAKLDALGVPWVDLHDPLVNGRAQGIETFLRTDTHWTPDGAALAAGAVAVRLRELGLTAQQPDPEFRVVKRLPSESHEGDLLSFLPLKPTFPSLLPPPDQLTRLQIEPKPDTVSADDLFSDSALPSVALVGTSYSANPLFSFAASLEAAIGEEVANYAKEGTGPFPPMAAYLNGEDLAAHPPRVVIWEIPVRALPGGVRLDLYYSQPTDADPDLDSTSGVENGNGTGSAVGTPITAAERQV